MSDPNVRDATPADLKRLVAIYNHYVEHTPTTFDDELYTEETRRPWFEGFAPSGPHRLFVAEEFGTPVGWAASREFRPKAAYATTVETSVYLDHAATGRGLGARLYSALFAALGDEDLHRAVAGVTLPNDASVALHERFGFAHIGRFGEVGRKFGRYHDVLWMEKPL
jgi:phosphinothricin acetyltransferase